MEKPWPCTQYDHAKLRTRDHPDSAAAKVNIQRWLQEEDRLSIGLSALFASYEPSSEVRGFLDELDSHVKECLNN